MTAGSLHTRHFTGPGPSRRAARYHRPDLDRRVIKDASVTGNQRAINDDQYGLAIHLQAGQEGRNDKGTRYLELPARVAQQDLHGRYGSGLASWVMRMLVPGGSFSENTTSSGFCQARPAR